MLYRDARTLLTTAMTMYILSGLGGKPSPSTSDINGVVAMLNFYSFFFSFGWAPAPYATASEVPANEVRRTFP